MAAVARQPFAPLDAARLQKLESERNVLNAHFSSPAKRKASEIVDTDDVENSDPVVFSKRSKGSNGVFTSDLFKPSSSLFLTKSASTPTIPTASLSPVKLTPSTSRWRRVIKPKSPSARPNPKISVSTPSTAPAGRSPPRGSRRVGILSRRRTSRIDPPAFSLGASAPFSLDAALMGTIPSYKSHGSNISSGVDEGRIKASWDFHIHEDTPEQEMTNLLQHSTCILDISSDEETEQRVRRERAEGRDKENIAPPDDVSQTRRTQTRAATASVDADAMVVEKVRGPLMERNVSDFYEDGCDESSVFIVPGDEDCEEDDLSALATASTQHYGRATSQDTGNLAALSPAPLPLAAEADVSLEAAIRKNDDVATKAAVLAPIEGAGQSFELWESGSAEGETSAPGSPAPAVV